MDKLREQFEKFYCTTPLVDDRSRSAIMWEAWQAAAALYREAGRVEGREEAANEDVIERILFRRALEHKLEGYTQATALEIADALRAAVRKEGA